MSFRLYFLRRIVQLVPVIIAIITVTFLLVQLAPGDVAIVLAGEDANPDYIASIREKYGWKIDHIKPVAKGGTDDLNNLQPLQWANNRHKSDNYPNWDLQNQELENQVHLSRSSNF